MTGTWPSSASWATAGTAFVVLGWPVALGRAEAFSFEPLLWFFLGWVLLIRFLALRAARGRRGEGTSA